VHIKQLKQEYDQALTTFSDVKCYLEYARDGGDNQALREAEVEFEVAEKMLINASAKYFGSFHRCDRELY
jgi:hypothetical protein